MDIPFNLTFIHNGDKSYRSEVKVLHFVSNSEELARVDGESVITLTENVDLTVLFTCIESNAAFYMDGLDTLPETLVKEDEKGEVYLSPSDKEQALFTNKDYENNYSFYPLIPGFYRIKVEVRNKSFYALIRVKPKQLFKEQWELMINEIEETLHGLAQDLVRRNSNINTDGDSPIPTSFMRQWFLLNNHKSKILNAVEEIKKSPRHHILKKYELVPKALAKRIDGVSIKYMSQHPEKRDVFKEPKPILGYNLPENRWLLHMVVHLATITNSLYNFLFSYEETVEAEIVNLKKWGKSAEVRLRTKHKVLNRVREMRNNVRQFRSVWNNLLIVPWFEDVSKSLPREMPMALSMDNRYRTIYKIYCDMKIEEYSISLDPAYNYHWKRTDYLYEIWGYIQVIRAFVSEELGFKPSKGWLYDTQNLDEGLVIPELTPGSYVEFIKDNLRIRVVYEEELPSSPDGTSMDKPLYTSSPHYLPDCRIDVFDENGYIGSLLLDFKYRPKESIWNRNLIKTRSQTKVMKQLDAYTTACRSPLYLKGRNTERVISRFRPVLEVWPIYPFKYHGEIKRDIDEYHIRMMDLTPAKDNMHFISQIQWAIEEMKGIANEITN
ncbi:DUF2357 domain-containing protein [Metabacillus fastidiosus]|uniref:DUF2357 domain-containing protein n=1 Tax=Metabacillus fastidiosus TaxID=1458 RepID=UPI002E2059B3|nr:DUF2357 domain-containing protein [Metabacillus fastidiosus]